MENVAGYEDYEKEFREVSLPEYRWLAQTMLTQAIEDSGCQMDGSYIHARLYQQGQVLVHIPFFD